MFALPTLSKLIQSHIQHANSNSEMSDIHDTVLWQSLYDDSGFLKVMQGACLLHFAQME